MLFLDRRSINLSPLYIENNHLVIYKDQQFTLVFRSFRIEYYFGVIFHVFWYACDRLDYGLGVVQVFDASYIDCALNVHRRQHAIRRPDVCTNDLIVMVVDYGGIVFIPSFFEVPYFYGLVHGA